MIYNSMLGREDMMSRKIKIAFYVLRIANIENLKRAIFIGLLLKQMRDAIQQVACRFHLIGERAIRAIGIALSVVRPSSTIAPV